MKVLKRIVCIFLSVMILFFGVSNSYFSPVKLDNVQAAETIILSEEIARLICEYFGAMTYGYASADEAKPNITTDDLAKLGHEFIKGLYDVNGIPPEIADVQKELIENKQAFGMLSYLGQSYVFGSEALQEVAGMDFNVIQGGSGEDPDEESKLKKFAKTAFALTTTGGLFISQTLPWVATELLHRVTEPEYKEEYFESYKNLKNENGKLDYYLYLKIDDVYCFEFNITNYNSRLAIIADHTKDGWIELYSVGTTPDNYYTSTSSYDDISLYDYKVKSTVKRNDGIIYDYGKCTNTTGYSTWNASKYYTISTNIPIFKSKADCLLFQKGQDDIKPENQKKTYDIADWLKDDWSGVLYDPLTGLNTGNDWFTLVRQGLASASTVGEDATGETYRNGLRDYFKDARENRDEANAPYIDPALAPIYLPATMPEVKIDPDANIAVSPATNPNPEPDPEPDPEPSATATPTPGTGGLPYTKPVVDLSKFFPFCIPFDLIHLVQALDADPVAPKWTLKLEPPQFPVEWEVTLDLSQFESLAKIFRTGETLLFVVGLILITRGIIKG